MTGLVEQLRTVEAIRGRARWWRLVTPCCQATSFLRGGLSECVFCGVGYEMSELVRREPIQ